MEYQFARFQNTVCNFVEKWNIFNVLWKILCLYYILKILCLYYILKMCISYIFDPSGLFHISHRFKYYIIFIVFQLNSMLCLCIVN